MSKVGFVGLGTMGAPMAGHLLKAGHSVVVWNRTPSKAEPLRAQGAEVAADLAELASKCDVIMLCVNRSEDVRAVVEGLKPGLKAGTVVVDHSTIEPPVAKAIRDELDEVGVGFVDAPITGGSMGANAGTLTIFCGGDEPIVAKAMPYLKAYAKRAERVGGSGQGQMMKLANQIAVGGALMALCETLAFAEKAGLDLSLAKDMIGGGAAGSWAFDNYGPKVLNRDWTPGFSIKNQRKDFGYCRTAAAGVGASIPGTELVDGMLAKLDQDGHGEWTTAALFEVYLQNK